MLSTPATSAQRHGVANWSDLARLAAVLGRGLRGGGRTFLPRSILGVRKSGLCADDAVPADTRLLYNVVSWRLLFRILGGVADGAAEGRARRRWRDDRSGERDGRGSAAIREATRAR